MEQPKVQVGGKPVNKIDKKNILLLLVYPKLENIYFFFATFPKKAGNQQLGSVCILFEMCKL